MTTYWLLGEKKLSIDLQSSPEEELIISEHVLHNNPSIVFQGPDSPSLKLSDNNNSEGSSPSPSLQENPIELIKANKADPSAKEREQTIDRDRIKREIATYIARDLIKNIDTAVNEFKKSQSNPSFMTNGSSDRKLVYAKNEGLITPTYDSELVISKGKVRDVVNRFNSCVLNNDSAPVGSKIPGGRAFCQKN